MSTIIFPSFPYNGQIYPEQPVPGVQQYQYNAQVDTWELAAGPCCGITEIDTGTGLTGGPITTTGTISLADTTVVPGNYTNPNITVDAQGRITFAASGNSGTVTLINTGTGLTGGPITTNGTISLADTTVTPGVYTNANITVDAQGRITLASSGTSGTVTLINTGTGLTGGPISSTGTISLANTAVTPGVYTNANITVDAQGRITLASSGTAGGVEQIIAGSNIQISPPGGTGIVTISATGGGNSNNSVLLDSISSQFDGVTTTFNLTSSGVAYSPPNAVQMIVTVGNIMQEAFVDYTISGSTITFTTAPVAGLDCLLLVLGGGQAAPASNLLLDSIQSGFDGVATTFNLLSLGDPYTPANAEQLVVNLGGIQQQPGVDYTVSGSTITFTTAPITGLNCFIIALYGGGFGAPSTGGGGVSQIIAGSNITISPTGGTGAVTINATGGGGGGIFSADSSNNIWSCNTVQPQNGAYNNFLVGCRAGAYLSGSGAYNNVFIGCYAGFCGNINTTYSDDNIFIGECSGYYNQGYYNNFLGRFSGLHSTYGYANNFIGYKAGCSNTTGSDNNFIGNLAGNLNTTGSYNVYIGGFQGSGFSTCNNHIFIADGGANNLRLMFNDYGAMGVGGTNFGTTGQVLTSNGTNSPPTWSVATPPPSIFCADANYNIWSCLTGAGGFHSGTGNFFAGFCAGYASATVCGNTFIGCLAGCGNSTGNYNNFFGSRAGLLNYSGSYNNFLGARAGEGNCYGCHNNYFGFSAGDGARYGSNNNVFGMCAGFCIWNGNHNNFIGTCAGFWNNGGSDNIAIGACANFWNQGSNNIVIGCNAGVSSTTPVNVSNQIFLGNNAHTNAFIRIGWTVTSDERDKTCVTQINHGREFLQKLNPVQFNWKDRDSGELTDEKPRYGFLAQEVLKAEGEPPIIVDDSDAENLKLRESMMIPLMFKIIQEMDEELRALRSEVERLKLG